MVDLRCPSCKKWLKIDERFRGQKGKCAMCGAPMRVPKKSNANVIAMSVVGTLCVLLALGAIIDPPQPQPPVAAAPAAQALQAAPAPEPRPAPRPATRPANKITLQKFNQIQQGMSYQQVVNILGVDGVVMSENSIDMGQYSMHSIMYSWDAGFMASMNCMFQNGKLMSKSQFGLK